MHNKREVSEPEVEEVADHEAAHVEEEGRQVLDDLEAPVDPLASEERERSEDQQVEASQRCVLERKRAVVLVANPKVFELELPLEVDGLGLEFSVGVVFEEQRDQEIEEQNSVQHLEDYEENLREKEVITDHRVVVELSQTGEEEMAHGGGDCSVVENALSELVDCDHGGDEDLAHVDDGEGNQLLDHLPLHENYRGNEVPEFRSND